MKKILPSFMFVVFCFLFGNASNAERIIQFTKVDRPPEFKGDLSDPAWKKAKAHGDFYLLGKKQKAKAQTEVYALYDEENLYLGVICLEPMMNKTVAAITKHDGPVFTDDDIEIFVSPTGKRMFQFILNNIGTKCETANEYYESAVSDLEWSNPWHVQTAKGTDRWTAEIIIPFSSLELEAGTPESWVLNVGRERVPERELSAIIQVYGFWAWHDVIKGVKTSPLDVDFSKFYYRVEDIALSTKYVEERGMEKSVEVTVVNNSGNAGKVEVEVSAVAETEVERWSKPVDIGKDEKKVVSIPIPGKLEDVDSLSWQIKIKDVSRNISILARNYNKIDNKPLLDIFEVQPVYNSKFYTGQERKVVLDVGVNSRAAGLSLEFNISRDGKVLENVRDAVGKKDYRFDFGKYDYGRYSVETKLLGQKGEVITADTREIEILKPLPGCEVTIAQGNYLLVNGKPFFPLGFFHAPTNELETLKELGFTANFTYDRSIDLNEKKLKDLIAGDYAATAKLGMLRPIDMNGRAIKDLSKDYLLPEEVEILKRVANIAKDSPGLLAYYLHDEPEGHNVSPKLLASFSRVIKESDAYHPTIILGHTMGIKKFFVSDIYMPDAYIGCIQGKTGDLRVVRTDMDLAMEVVRKRRGKGMIMATLKAIDYTGDDSDVRAPTFEEMRNSTYCAIVHGARGIFYYTYYGHSGVKAYPECWEAVKMIGREMKYLIPVIFSDSPAPNVEVSDKNIEILAKKYDGNIFIIALNTQPGNLRAQFTLSEDVASVSVLSEGRTIKAGKNSFSDSFDGYAVHIYTTDKHMPSLPTIKAVKARITKDLSDKLKSGNFALAAAGTKITSSTRIAWGGKLANIINGVRDDGERLWDYVKKDKPQWIELQFSGKRRVSKILVDNAFPYQPNPTIIDYELQVNQDGKWVMVAEKKNNTAPVIKADITPVTTDKVRLTITRQAEGGHRFCVNEIEVY
ncbi:MAG: discoidin domain-containing protein [Verrucomicrobiota bacterium]